MISSFDLSPARDRILRAVTCLRLHSVSLSVSEDAIRAFFGERVASCDASLIPLTTTSISKKKKKEKKSQANLSDLSVTNGIRLLYPSRLMFGQVNRRSRVLQASSGGDISLMRYSSCLRGRDPLPLTPAKQARPRCSSWL